MSVPKVTSGRHSRYPAVDRSGRSADPKPEPVVEVEAPAAPVEAEVPAPVEAPAEESVDLSSMSADDVLTWAGDDEERRSVALSAEQSRDKPRKTVLRELDSNFEG